MDPEAIQNLMGEVRDGDVSPDDATARLAAMPFVDLGHSRIDHHRELRTGLAEAVYAPGKTSQHLLDAVGELLQRSATPVVATRVLGEQAADLQRCHPGADRSFGPHHGGHPSETFVWRRRRPGPHKVIVAAAGTSDLPVASECEAVLTAYGAPPTLLSDVGVAGLHRLLAETAALQSADAVVVVAGMEGALASVVGGLTGAPVVAVPTSAGYGSSMDGITALLAMLSSCASGVAVVGIDNGFGAACAVLRQIGRIDLGRGEGFGG